MRDWHTEGLRDWRTELVTPQSQTPPPPRAGASRPNATLSELGEVAGGTSLASRVGAFGDASKQIGGYAGELGNVLGIYQGLQKGGFVGYGGAGVNAAMLGSRLGAFGAESSAIGGVVGPLAAGFALYNFAENWRSGATGSDAIAGAEAGAAIGSVVPVVGTALGAVIGGAVGAISSLFGPGRQDPETVGWDSYAGAYAKHGAQGVSGATPADNFKMLAGIFDARGSSIPFYGKFGRMGENQFTTAMTTQINQALAKGKVSKTDTPQTIYSKVVAPWVASMSPNGWQDSNTIQGAPEKAAIGNLLTSMIGQYQKGQQSGWTGIDGQAAPPVQSFGALGSVDPAKTKAAVEQSIAPVHSAVLSMPGFGTGSGANSSAMLPLFLAMPALAAGASAMADPNNPTMSAGGPGGDPMGPPPATSGAPDWLSNLGTGFSNFLSGPGGTLAEFGTLGAIGLSQAGSQKRTNDQLAGGLAATGAPFTAAGAGILTQLEGGPSVGGPLGKSITQQTDTAANLGKVAQQYSTGALTGPQQTQVENFIKQQRAMVDTQLAASGNTDSSARQAAYQQIDDHAAQLGESLIAQNTQIAEGALTAVQGTYSNLLNQALSSSEFGFSTQEAAVQTQIQSDTQLATSLNQLFAGIAQGVGSAMGGKPGGQPGQPGGGSAAGSAVAQIAKGVAGSAAGGGGSTDAGWDPSGVGQAADSQAWFDQQAMNTDTSLAFDPGYTGDLTSYTDYGAFYGD